MRMMKQSGGNVASRLVSEARAMLGEGGVGKLKLRALADRVGITAGSMYYHFDSKRSLLGIIAAAGYRRLAQELEIATDACRQREEIRAWARGYFAFAQREPQVFELMFDPEMAVLSNVEEARSELLGQFRATVAGMNEKYGLRIGQIDEITLAMWAAAHGAASLGPKMPCEGEFLDQVISGLEAVAMLHSRQRSG